MAKKKASCHCAAPVPYICAEWEAAAYRHGYLPIQHQVRTRDERFLAASDRYLARLGRELAPLQATHGGPIIAVQVENEYGLMVTTGCI